MTLNTKLAGARSRVYWRAQDPSRSAARNLSRLTSGAGLILALLVLVGTLGSGLAGGLLTGFNLAVVENDALSREPVTKMGYCGDATCINQT